MVSAAHLTRRQKRLLVQGRLIEEDAREMSDRAIARELRVSQPFVSALRRQRSVRDNDNRAVDVRRERLRVQSEASRYVPDDDEPLEEREYRTTTAQEALVKFH